MRPDLTVATILDRFTSSALRHEWNQVEVRPDGWREELEREPPQLLFVESAWKGNEDRWHGALVGTGETAQPFADLVGWCRDRGIPTVFWNKEDPPHFSRFVEAARLFDHVFTVDSECVPRYAEVLGHERVGVLRFGAQPRIHNPIAVPGGRRHEVVFAGTYLGDKRPERRAQMEAILGPAQDFGLHIFTRMPLGEKSKFDWPPTYRPHIVGSLPYERMLAAFKSYKLSLNVNTVTHSPTMCARRVFEIAATGTPVLSGDSVALRAVFGDLIPIARDEAEARDQLARLLGDGELRERTAHAAMREVFAKHTYTKRVDDVLAAVGLPTGTSTPSVSIILPLDRVEGSTPAIQRAAGQRWPRLQLVIAPRAHGFDTSALAGAARSAGADDVVVLPFEESLGPGQALNRALDAATGQLFALMDAGCDYEQHYVEDLAAAFTYTDASIVGKGAHYSPNRTGGSPRLENPADEHAYTDRLHPGTLIVAAELARRAPFDSSADDPVPGFLARCLELGGRAYAADRFSFLSSA